LTLTLIPQILKN